MGTRIIGNRIIGFFYWLKNSTSWFFLKSSLIRREVLAFVSLAVCLVMTLSLLSFDGSDKVKVLGIDDFKNWLGPVGSWLSLRLLIYCGFFSVVMPAIFFFASVGLFFEQKISRPVARAYGLVLISVGLMPIASILYPKLIGDTFLVAGIIGHYFHRNLALYLSSLGLWIISFTMMACGMVYILGKPYLARGVDRLSSLFDDIKKGLFDGGKAIIRVLPPIIPMGERDGSALLNNAVVPKSQAPKGDVPSSIPPSDQSVPSDIHIVERERVVSLSTLREAEMQRMEAKMSFELPPLNLLDYDAPKSESLDPHILKKEADKLQRAFLQFGIEGKIREIRPGPVVTNYEFVPAPGIKLSRIASLCDDIAMAMSAVQVRIVTPIPGKGAVGIEVPNDKREMVYLKEIVAHESYRKIEHKLCLAIGKDVEGSPYFMNLADMPHVLIAGSTGSGKSVSVNAMICSILYRATPRDVRFLMIDPKMLELSIYNGIPHLLLPPIIDAKKAANALRWAVMEMEQRYALMKEAAVRDIASYNDKIAEQAAPSFNEIDGRKHEHLPYIVIVVDEYADLLAVAGKEVEGYVMRLAQKARAAGIHVMLATQRPSVDVITGVIKANFPVRMGFRLASAHDSKTIVNKTGAEKLLGKGDALIMPPGSSDLFRVHGAFISEKELIRVVDFLSSQHVSEYRQDIAEFSDSCEGGEQEGEMEQKDADEKFSDALNIVKEHNRCSTSFLQRHLCIGYNRAARIVEQMERAGIVGPVLNARGDREIFVNQSESNCK